MEGPLSPTMPGIAPTSPVLGGAGARLRNGLPEADEVGGPPRNLAEELRAIAEAAALEFGTVSSGNPARSHQSEVFAFSGSGSQPSTQRGISPETVLAAAPEKKALDAERSPRGRAHGSFFRPVGQAEELQPVPPAGSEEHRASSRPRLRRPSAQLSLNSPGSDGSSTASARSRSFPASGSGWPADHRDAGRQTPQGRQSATPHVVQNPFDDMESVWARASGATAVSPRAMEPPSARSSRQVATFTHLEGQSSPAQAPPHHGRCAASVARTVECAAASTRSGQQPQSSQTPQATSGQASLDCSFVSDEGSHRKSPADAQRRAKSVGSAREAGAYALRAPVTEATSRRGVSQGAESRSSPGKPNNTTPQRRRLFDNADAGLEFVGSAHDLPAAQTDPVPVRASSNLVTKREVASATAVDEAALRHAEVSESSTDDRNDSAAADTSDSNLQEEQLPTHAEQITIEVPSIPPPSSASPLRPTAPLFAGMGSSPSVELASKSRIEACSSRPAAFDISTPLCGSTPSSRMGDSPEEKVAQAGGSGSAAYQLAVKAIKHANSELQRERELREACEEAYNEAVAEHKVTSGKLEAELARRAADEELWQQLLDEAHHSAEELLRMAEQSKRTAEEEAAAAAVAAAQGRLKAEQDELHETLRREWNQVEAAMERRDSEDEERRRENEESRMLSLRVAQDALQSARETKELLQEQEAEKFSLELALKQIKEGADMELQQSRHSHQLFEEELQSLELAAERARSAEEEREALRALLDERVERQSAMQAFAEEMRQEHQAMAWWAGEAVRRAESEVRRCREVEDRGRRRHEEDLRRWHEEEAALRRSEVESARLREQEAKGSVEAHRRNFLRRLTRCAKGGRPGAEQEQRLLGAEQAHSQAELELEAHRLRRLRVEECFAMRESDDDALVSSRGGAGRPIPSLPTLADVQQFLSTSQSSQPAANSIATLTFQQPLQQHTDVCPDIAQGHLSQQAADSPNEPAAADAPAFPRAVSSTAVPCPNATPGSRPADPSRPPSQPIPLAVRISRCQTQGLLSSRIIYTIIVEGPGAPESVTKEYTDFGELEATLKSRSLGSDLPTMPQDWVLRGLSQILLERRRRHLEAYLADLCSNQNVLLDSAIWSWLGVDNLTQVAVKLVAAHNAARIEEVSGLLSTLEVVLSSEGSDVSHCVHPSVLGSLQAVLAERNSTDATAGACRLLDLILTRSDRARQLFLTSAAGGAAVLAQRCREGDLHAAATIQKVLEAVVAEESLAQAPGASADVARGGANDRSGGAELGECCVCLDHGKSHALLPCGHLCACMDCASFLLARGSTCPVCRRPIERHVQIFF